MSSTSSEAFARWVDEAKGADLVAFLIEHRGAKLRKSGGDYAGPCPVCGGDDRFVVTPRNQTFFCRGSGRGGDYIKAIEYVDNCDFLAAAEALTGRPAPDRERPARSAPARQERREPPPRPEPEPVVKRPAGDAARFAEMFAKGAPIGGTPVEAYLSRRGLAPSTLWTADIRFFDALAYHGYPDPDADELKVLGKFPAMVAAIRDVAGEIIGLHRTYLSRELPVKLSPPGDQKRNKAKKIVGAAKGGAIRLSPPSPVLVIGEGIETTRAAGLLGIGEDGAGFWAAISLGNLAGGAAGSIPHPNGRGSIMNGEPDPDRPGMLLPPEVREVVILGDGDSDKARTMAHLLTGGRRWKDAGLSVFYAVAPDGKDWNDVLLEQGAAS